MQGWRWDVVLLRQVRLTRGGRQVVLRLVREIGIIK